MKHVWLSMGALTLFLAGNGAAPAAADDWPQWRGTDRAGLSSERGLLQEWPEKGPRLAWKVTGLGGGDSTPSVAAGRIYGLSNRGDDEVVWAISEKDGSPVWSTRLGPAYRQERKQSKEGPGSAPTIDGDRLYVIGMGGAVACLRADSGTIVWQRSMTDSFGGIVPPWSYRESPLVDGDKVLCTPGGPEVTIAALSKKTGETIWTTLVPGDKADDDSAEDAARSRRGPRSGAGYSSPIAFDFGGVRQYAQFTATALVGVAATDGKLLWRHAPPSNEHGINCSTPLFHDGQVFAASAYGNGGGAVELAASSDGTITAKETYFTARMQNHHGGMVIVDGCLYGAHGGNSGGFLSCLDFRSGELLWRDRDAPKGSVAFADGRLYLRSEEGEILLVEPDRERFIEKGRFEQPDRTDLPAWAYPVIANGKLYIRDHDMLLCYDIRAKV